MNRSLHACSICSTPPAQTYREATPHGGEVLGQAVLARDVCHAGEVVDALPGREAGEALVDDGGVHPVSLWEAPDE
jgi:hypothetical protein